MDDKVVKLAKIATAIKTPMALSGLITIILYALYKQVLSLNVFSNIGADPTFIILQDVLGKLFWLALVALVLGVLSYVTTGFLSHKEKRLSSRVRLLDASLDHTRSPYEQTIEQDYKKIKRRGTHAHDKGASNDQH